MSQENVIRKTSGPKTNEVTGLHSSSCLYIVGSPQISDFYYKVSKAGITVSMSLWHRASL
jgi:hypothetical protein